MLFFLKQLYFRIFIYISLLLLLLVTTIFYTPSYLKWRLEHANISKTELLLAKHLIEGDFHKYYSSKQFYGTEKWLSAQKYLAIKDGNNAFELSQYFQALNRTDERLVWLEKAAILRHQNAKITLARISYKKSKFKETKAYIEDLNTREAYEFKVKLAMQSGNDQELEKLITESREYHHGLYLELKGFVITKSNPMSKACKFPIQFYATRLEDLRKIKAQINKIDENEFANFICFEPIKYISQSLLECEHDTTKAISCNESIWQQVEIPETSYYLGIVVPKGGANVHHGILYLDADDNLDVLNHELAHLLGFIDEYQLKDTHDICQNQQVEPFSLNIAVLQRLYQGNKSEVRARILSQISWRDMILEETPVMTKTKQGWLVGTPANINADYALYKSETCATQGLVSVKPVKSANMMRYNELAFLRRYQKLLEQSQSSFAMPSYHFNVALALSQKQKKTAARTWLNKSFQAKNN